MHLEIRRVKFTANTTLGRMYIDGKFFCWTLEDLLRHPMVKVMHKTAIPCGWYKLVINRSPRFKRLMPLILDTPGFRGIRIHSGNSEHDTSGCPLVGTRMQLQRDGDYKVLDSRTADREMMSILETAKERGHSFSISIINDFDWDGVGE